MKFDLECDGQKRSLKFRFAAFSDSHIFRVTWILGPLNVIL